MEDTTVSPTLESTPKPSAAIGSVETAAPQAEEGFDTVEPTLESDETGAPQVSMEDTTVSPTLESTLKPSAAVGSVETAAPQAEGGFETVEPTLESDGTGAPQASWKINA